MRARYPDTEGFVERDGVKVAYAVFGAGEPALVFAPTDPLVHSRAWKAQVPYLARRSRVVTIDPRGNGRADRPPASAACADSEYVAAAGAGPRRGPHRLLGPLPHPAQRGARRLRLRRGLRYRRGLGQGQPALLAARLAGVRRDLFSRASCPAAT